mmetsp:Transcript_4234/g.10183  ORF Transcript_4234/g.10183 Transcript_4234/m.10183 type:complete len:339 (+) Transcript_4234:3224-4240(+)
MMRTISLPIFRYLYMPNSPTSEVSRCVALATSNVAVNWVSVEMATALAAVVVSSRVTIDPATPRAVTVPVVTVSVLVTKFTAVTSTLFRPPTVIHPAPSVPMRCAAEVTTIAVAPELKSVNTLVRPVEVRRTMSPRLIPRTSCASDATSRVHWRPSRAVWPVYAWHTAFFVIPRYIPPVLVCFSEFAGETRTVCLRHTSTARTTAVSACAVMGVPNAPRTTVMAVPATAVTVMISSSIMIYATLSPATSPRAAATNVVAGWKYWPTWSSTAADITMAVSVMLTAGDMVMSVPAVWWSWKNSRPQSATASSTSMVTAFVSTPVDALVSKSGLTLVTVVL